MKINSCTANKFIGIPLTFKGNKSRNEVRISESYFNANSALIPTYDTFTGLKDKNTLLMDLSKKMYKKEDISIGMFDMDNFKSINELLGYKVGDDFIKAISEGINTVAKKYGVDAYRFGGDEFVVLLFSDMSKKEKLQIVNDIISTTSQIPTIKDNASTYLSNANVRLDSYEKSNTKIKKLLSLRTERDLLYSIYENSTIAKEDPYLQNKLLEVDEDLQALYSSLIAECLVNEKDEQAKRMLKSNASNLYNSGTIEYLIDKYDRSHELYRLKKWTKDFNKNGFHITGGVAVFKFSSYKDKLPIDIIDIVGEYLKESKENKNSYYVELE